MIFSSPFWCEMDRPESEAISQYHFIAEMPSRYDVEASIDVLLLDESESTADQVISAYLAANM